MAKRKSGESEAIMKWRRNNENKHNNENKREKQKIQYNTMRRITRKKPSAANDAVLSSAIVL